MSYESENEQVRKALEKKKNDDLLIAGLLKVANSIRQGQILWKVERPISNPTRAKIITAALSGCPEIQLFHKKHMLGSAIKQLQLNNKLPQAVSMEIISDLLHNGGYAPLDSSAYSAFSPTRTSFAIFSPAETSESLALKRRALQSSPLAIAGVLGTAGLFTAIGLLIKSAVVVKAAVTVMAVAATASAAFPPLAIIGLAIGGAALLATAIGVTVIAIQHYRSKQMMDTLLSLATRGDRANSYS